MMNLQRYEVQPVFLKESLCSVPARDLGKSPWHYDREFKEGDIVQHFKGGLYRIKGFATHTETEETMVIYQSLEDGKLWSEGRVWARPYNMFTSLMDKNKYPDATQPWRLIKVRLYSVSELEEET